MAIVEPKDMDFSNKNIIMIITGLPGVGKACADSTKVLTDMGLIPICELREGMEVYGEDGELHSIVGVFPQGVRPSYRVSFNDNTSVICDESHIWTVKAAIGNSRKCGWQPFTVKNLIEKGIDIDSPSRAATNRQPLLKWEIPIVKPINKKAQNFYIAPYIMGVLLGDGSLSADKPIFSNPYMDIEIKEKVERNLMPGYILTKREASCPAYYIKSPNNDNKYAQVIKEFGINVRSKEKRIPYQYMNGSVEQRTELLNGLMDTDGSAIKNRVSFSTMSPSLAQDVVALVQSLGGIAKIHTYDRTKEDKGIEYDVNVRINICPFSLERKAGEWKPTIITRYIKKIEKVEDVSCTCIMVDNPTNLFVLENHIVTHNTTLACSAPKVAIIDADNGMVRVNPAHRKTASLASTYEEMKADIKSLENKYETLVIDTGGALIELMKEWAARTEPTASKKSGGFSQQGYGIIKSEFLTFSAELRKKFNVIYIFHTAKDKNGDEVFYDIICEGSAKTMVWQPADLGAYLHIVNGDRYLGFTPTMNYSAKAAYGIKGLVKVPELAIGEENVFLTKLFDVVKKNLKNESESLREKTELYEAAMVEGKEIIAAVNGLADIDEARNQLKAIKHELTSGEELLTLLKKRIAELNIVWNVKAKIYEQQ